jgi:DNA-directed RNA polymerase specialized sigma24 family protein
VSVNPYDEWVRRLLGERFAENALVPFLRNRGVPEPVARQLVEDGLQEGLLTVTQTSFGFWQGDYRHFQNAVIQAARRRLIDQYRACRARRECLLGEEILLGAPAQPAPEAWAFEILLEVLTPRQRKLIRQRFEQGLNLREMAERLPADRRTDKARISEVVRLLRAAYLRLRAVLEEPGEQDAQDDPPSSSGS